MPDAVLLSRKPPQGKVARTVGAVAKRYEKHPKSIDRWLAKGVRVAPGAPPIKFPPPDLILNGVRHWFDETIDRFDAGVKAALAASRDDQTT
jgi:hypothetical protein